MNHIDRLLIQARKAFHPPVYSALCIIDHDDITGKWKAAPQLWDGIPGSGFMDDAIPKGWVSEYNTADEAYEAVGKLFASLNISKPDRTVILIDDVGV